MDISTPSKLLKFKKYLTPPEAAKHLSNVCNDEVTEADILKFALDGYLKLSIYFGCTVYGKSGYLEDKTLSKALLKQELTGDMYTKVTKFMDEHLSKFNFVENEKASVVPLYDGVFDLPMIGSEWGCIKRKWTEQRGSFPSEKHNGLDAILIVDRKGDVYALQEVEAFNEDEFLLSGLKLSLEVEKQIRSPSYYPAGGLPSDSSLLVRTDALREFERLIDSNEAEMNVATDCSPNKSELSETERNTMLKLIQGMAIDAYGYDPESTRNSATVDKNGISTKLRTRGINIDADTIRKYLNAAKE